MFRTIRAMIAMLNTFAVFIGDNYHTAHLNCSWILTYYVMRFGRARISFVAISRRTSCTNTIEWSECLIRWIFIARYMHILRRIFRCKYLIKSWNTETLLSLEGCWGFDYYWNNFELSAHTQKKFYNYNFI